MYVFPLSCAHLPRVETNILVPEKSYEHADPWTKICSARGLPKKAGVSPSKSTLVSRRQSSIVSTAVTANAFLHSGFTAGASANVVDIFLMANYTT